MTLREDYNRDGYAVIDSDDVDMVCFQHWNEISLRETFNCGIDKYISWLSMAAKSAMVQKLFMYSVIKTLVKLGLEEAIIISQPILHVMSPALRVPHGYYGTSAHQDWPSTQGSLDCITVWIALTDAGIGNFPLEIIPGSHKRGLLEGKMNGSVLEVEANEEDFVPIECKAGDVVFLSGFTVHRTGAGTGFRVAVSQRFDNAAESTFIERGYPCAQKRTVDRKIGWKPSSEQVQKVFS